MKKRTKIILAVVVVLIGSLVALGAFKKNQKKLVEVTVAEVERVDLTSKVSANGKIEAQRKKDKVPLPLDASEGNGREPS